MRAGFVRIHVVFENIAFDGIKLSDANNAPALFALVFDSRFRLTFMQNSHKSISIVKHAHGSAFLGWGRQLKFDVDCCELLVIFFAEMIYSLKYHFIRDGT